MNAVLSEDGIYRYALWRDLPRHVPGTASFVCPATGQVHTRNDEHEDSTWFTENDICLFVMLNPSTADGHEDDPTIRRCIAFGARWGFGRISVANLYAFRSTNPEFLGDAADPVGPDNDDWICQLANEASFTVAAWGANKAVDAGRVREVMWMLDHDQGVVCLRRTADGAPGHPLYVHGETQPRPYSLEVIGA